MILRQKSIHLECHSGLDLACPVPDTGKSSAFLDSRWSLPRTRYGVGMTSSVAIDDIRYRTLKEIR